MARHTDRSDSASDASGSPETGSRQDAPDGTVRADGGTADAATQEQSVDYLDTRINILSPSTPFMSDHLRVVWATFVAWVIVVWGPFLATVAAPETMTSQLPVIGFPAHYFLIAFVAPTGSLLLAAVYARQRDKLDEKYGIDPTAVVDQDEGGSGEAAATDGGVDQ